MKGVPSLHFIPFLSLKVKVFTSLLTYVIPSGEYRREKKEIEGRERTRSLPGPTPGRSAAAILYRALDHYIEYQFDESGLDGGYMHDPLAVASVIDDGVLKTRTVEVTTSTSGDERGRTKGDAAANGRGSRNASV